VIPAFDTAPATVDTAMRLMREADKTPVRVKDVAGFAVNRMFLVFLNEAVRLSDSVKKDTKQINTWEFALQPLPQSQGTATWICTRADRWDGTGSTVTAFPPPGSAPRHRRHRGALAASESVTLVRPLCRKRSPPMS